MSTSARTDPVSRTDVGDQEIAVPSLGLSLAQRRLLTLLDTPTPASILAERSGLPPEKFVRDLGRLAHFRLIEGAIPGGSTQGAIAPTRGAIGPATITPVFRDAGPPVTIRAAANAAWNSDRESRKLAPRRRLGVAAISLAGVAVATIVAFGYLSRTPASGPHANPNGSPEGHATTPRPAPATGARGSTAQQVSDAVPAATPTLTSGGPTAAGGGPITGRSDSSVERLSRSDITKEIGFLRTLEARSRSSTSEPTPPVGPSRPVPDADRAHASADRFDPGATDKATRVSAEVTARTDAARTDAAPPLLPAAAPAASATPASVTTAPTTNAPTAVVNPEAVATPPAAAVPTTVNPATVAMPTTVAMPSMVATPAAAVAPPSKPAAELVPISRIAPEFPGEAIRRHIDDGRVRARVEVDAAGHVSAVTILSAAPRGVFDDAVTSAVEKWRFAPGASGRSTVVDVAFRRE